MGERLAGGEITNYGPDERDREEDVKIAEYPLVGALPDAPSEGAKVD